MNGKGIGSETDTISTTEVEKPFKARLYQNISFTYVKDNNSSLHNAKLVSYDMNTRLFEVEENGKVTGYNMEHVTYIS